MSWTDLHCHLNFLEVSPQQAVENALAADVTRILTIGTEPSDHPIVFDLAQKFAPHVFCTLGVHPHEAIKYNQECEDWMAQHFKNPRVVAIGEIGLDYYYDHSPREVQQQVFRRHL